MDLALSIARSTVSEILKDKSLSITTVFSGVFRVETANYNNIRRRVALIRFISV